MPNPSSYHANATALFISQGLETSRSHPCLNQYADSLPQATSTQEIRRLFLAGKFPLDPRKSRTPGTKGWEPEM